MNFVGRSPPLLLMLLLLATIYSLSSSNPLPSIQRTHKSWSAAADSLAHHVGLAEKGLFREQSNVGPARRLLLNEEALPPVHQRRTRPVNGCWAKFEQNAHFKADPFKAPSQKFIDRVKAYVEMHKRCTADVINWKDLFVYPQKGVKEGVDVSGCRFLLYQSPQWHGVGNRIMGLVSALAYALITDRAILMEDEEFLGQALCNPFPDSTWRMKKDDFRFILHNIKGYAKDPEKNKTVFELHMSWDYSPWSEFCAERQGEVSTSRFGLLYTDYYLVPAFYLNAKFREELQALFPKSRAFMHIGRHFLFPENHLWDRITRTFIGYLRHHNSRIGLQIRETKDTGVGLMKNVLDCLVNKSKLLAEAMPVGEWRVAAEQADKEGMLDFPRKSTGVFVTSLNGLHASMLHDMYTRGKPLDGSTVNVYSLSHYNQEASEDYQHYEAALVEMWLLSFSDALLITDYSTFGYVASGMAGIDPYMLNVAIRGGSDDSDWRRNGRPSCVPSFSEPCLVADVYQKCPSDKEAYLAATTQPLQTCPGVNKFVMVAPQTSA